MVKLYINLKSLTISSYFFYFYNEILLVSEFMQFLTKILSQVASIKVKIVNDSLFKYGCIAIVLTLIAGIFKIDTWILICIMAMEHMS